MDSREDPREEGETLVSIESKILTLYEHAKGRVDARHKEIEDIQAKIQHMRLSPSEKAEADILKIIMSETMSRGEEVLATLVVFRGLARYIDELQQTITAFEKRLEQIGGTAESRIHGVEELTKKHDEVYQIIDKIIQKGAEAANKEIPYVKWALV